MKKTYFFIHMNHLVAYLLILTNLHFFCSVYSQDCGIQLNGTQCPNNFCCSSYGYCGNTEDHCGPGCQSNCAIKNIVTECGVNAIPSGKECPLGVCCGEFGYCGYTSEFCNAKCQSNCNLPALNKECTLQNNRPSKIVGYYAGWSATNYNTTCRRYPGNLRVDLLTHLNFAFAIPSESFELVLVSPEDANILMEVVNLKQNNSELKVLISIGGMTVGGKPFSDIAFEYSRRQIFIQSTLNMVKSYNLDGIDLDWEYPGLEFGGRLEDYQNIVLLLKELREAIEVENLNLLVTLAVPGSFHILKQFDIQNIEPYIDWFNVMTYDYHGPWDAAQFGLEPQNAIYDILETLAIMNHALNNTSKIIPGLAFYGRSYNPSQTNCLNVGCPATPGPPAPCTGIPGYMGFFEISQLIQATQTSVGFNSTQLTNLVLVDNLWITFDNETTIATKLMTLIQSCFTGVMLWSLDLDTPEGTLLQSLSQVVKIPNFKLDLTKDEL